MEKKKVTNNITENIAKQKSIKEFQKIPGVGKSIANDFWELGFQSISDLKDQDPEELYSRLNELVGEKVCRCMLYVFRCAVYYSKVKKHDPQKLNWWYWKDKTK